MIRVNPFSLIIFPFLTGGIFFFISGFFEYGWHPGAQNEIDKKIQSLENGNVKGKINLSWIKQKN